MQLLTAAKSGNEDGSFGKDCADCGSECVSRTLTMEEGCYTSCLERKVPLSEGCATCFLGSAAYSLSNCREPCESSWCSKECLQCNEPYHEKVQECVGDIKLPSSWACDDSNWGKPGTLVDDTGQATEKLWQPERALPFGHIVSLYNIAARRFVRMCGLNLCSGREKNEADEVDDDERFSVVDASGDGRAGVIALHSEASGRFITIDNAMDIGTSDVADPKKAPKKGWSAERLTVVTIGGNGNFKTIALGRAERSKEADHFLSMDSRGILTMMSGAALEEAHPQDAQNVSSDQEAYFEASEEIGNEVQSPDTERPMSPVGDRALKKARENQAQRQRKRIAPIMTRLHRWEAGAKREVEKKRDDTLEALLHRHSLPVYLEEGMSFIVIDHGRVRGHAPGPLLSAGRHRRPGQQAEKQDGASLSWLPLTVAHCGVYCGVALIFGLLAGYCLRPQVLASSFHQHFGESFDSLPQAPSWGRINFDSLRSSVGPDRIFDLTNQLPIKPTRARTLSA